MVYVQLFEDQFEVMFILHGKAEHGKITWVRHSLLNWRLFYAVRQLQENGLAAHLMVSNCCSGQGNFNSKCKLMSKDFC